VSEPLGLRIAIVVTEGLIIFSPPVMGQFQHGLARKSKRQALDIICRHLPGVFLAQVKLSFRTRTFSFADTLSIPTTISEQALQLGSDRLVLVRTFTDGLSGSSAAGSGAVDGKIGRPVRLHDRYFLRSAIRGSGVDPGKRRCIDCQQRGSRRAGSGPGIRRRPATCQLSVIVTGVGGDCSPSTPQPGWPRAERASAGRQSAARGTVRCRPPHHR